MTFEANQDICAGCGGSHNPWEICPKFKENPPKRELMKPRAPINHREVVESLGTQIAGWCLNGETLTFGVEDPDDEHLWTLRVGTGDNARTYKAPGSVRLIRLAIDGEKERKASKGNNDGN